MKKNRDYSENSSREWEDYEEEEMDWDRQGDEAEEFYAEEEETEFDGGEEDFAYYESEEYAEEEAADYYGEEAVEEGPEYYEEEAADADADYYGFEEGTEDYDDLTDGDAFEESGYDADVEYGGDPVYDEAAVYEEKPMMRSGNRRDERRPQAKGGFFEKMCGMLRSMDIMDRIMVGTGVGVLILAIVTVSVFLGTRTVEKQVSDFANVGTQLNGIETIGERGLLAVADAELAKLAAASMVDTDEPRGDYDESGYERNVTVELNFTSIQKDLKIKFVNKRTGKLVPNVPFSVTVTDPDNKSQIWSDDDMDGIIYKTDIKPGTYKVAMEELSDSRYKDYIISTTSQSVEVKKDISYNKVDVANEVKTESEINASKEDTGKNDTVVESVLEDTVKWVASNKTPATYNEVQKNTIPDPMTLALNKSFMRMSSGTGSGNSNPVSVTVSLSATSGAAGEKLSGTATASGFPSGGLTYSISSSSAEVADARIDNAGNISVDLKKAGSATLTITVNDGTNSADSSVTVTATEPALTQGTAAVDPSALSGTVGSTLTAKVTPSGFTAGQDLSYKVESSAADVAEASIDQAGNISVNLKKAGTATLTVTVDYTKPDGTTNPASASIQVTVTDPAPALSKGTVTVDPAALTGTVGTSLAAKATASGFTQGQKLKYSIVSSQSTVATATIAGDGSITVQAVAPGTTKLTITVDYESKPAGTTTPTAAVAEITVTVTGKRTLTLDKNTLTAYTQIPVVINAVLANAGQNPVIKATSSDTNIATVKVDKQQVTVTGVAAGSAIITVEYTEGGETLKATCTVTVKANPKEDKTTKLKDNAGRQVYVLENGAYREAVSADYYTANKFFLAGEAKYTGWQTIDGKVYFFNEDGSKVTGEQIIQGAKYNFASDGSMMAGSNGIVGIDVSKWNGTIDWNAVKNSGISYVIIRCGYRGSSQGTLVVDPKYEANIKGASAAGLKVGVYFFTQAINEVEAVEEASMVLDLVKNYKLAYPIFLDVEGSGGRGDQIDKTTRTAVCKAFCQTIQNSGYTAGIYANKSWFETKIDADSLSSYKIWLAQYAAAPTYKGRYNIWQYRSTGKVSGISGDVDMNISYLGY